ncbi:hypothetical protein [Maricaulis sp.]|uniref:hypothetical protein n=1 Tax=Maricaulis sp. TaxID=1486257 RepID=UPI003A8DC22F
MRILTAIAMTIGLAATAAGQDAGRAARDARYTCEMLEDIGDALPGPVYYSRYFASAHDNPAFEFAGFDEFLRLLSGIPYAGGRSHASEDWMRAFRQLPLSVLQEAWNGWRAGGPISCPGIAAEQWATRTEMEARWRPIQEAGMRAATLPPNHPLRLEPPPSASGHFIQIARPVFNESGYRALLLDSEGMSATIYAYGEDGWRSIATEQWAYY